MPRIQLNLIPPSILVSMLTCKPNFREIYGSERRNLLKQTDTMTGPAKSPRAQPTHWPSEGRKSVAPIPAPMAAKTSDAEHLTVAPKTFLPRISNSALLAGSSSSSFDLNRRHRVL
uniref:Uncharacterized protein n=1 Tax=Opuntia streptacantha TaxID=393608 RepID=A0A7C9CGJ9_OPUST